MDDAKLLRRNGRSLKKWGLETIEEIPGNNRKHSPHGSKGGEEPVSDGAKERSERVSPPFSSLRNLEAGDITFGTVN
jgi:hypothetical protein